VVVSYCPNNQLYYSRDLKIEVRKGGEKKKEKKKYKKKRKEKVMYIHP
jgi:hypothetical protein